MPVLTADAIAHLPDPVQRSLHRSGLVDMPIPTAVAVSQKGAIRTSPSGRWLRFTAEENYLLDQPGFVWNARLTSAGVPVGRAVDSLEDGRGRMHVRILGLINVVDATGQEMDQGSLLRWLNETMWFPAVWASEVISWEPIDDQSAAASISAGGLTVQGEFRFDTEGRLVDFRADRYRDVKGSFEMTPWSTPLTEHAIFDGVELPSYGTAVWDLPDGDFEYIQIRLTDVRYTTGNP